MTDPFLIDLLAEDLDHDAALQLAAIVMTKQEDPDTEIPIPLDSPLGRVIVAKTEGPPDSVSDTE